MPQIPPIVGSDNNNYWDIFMKNNPNIKIYVQTDSLEKYKASEHWGIYVDNMIGYNFRKNGIIRQ